VKNVFFTTILSVSLLSLLIVVDGCDTNSDKSLLDPIEYVLGKIEDYDLVMVGEHHWTQEQPIFVQNLIKRCFEKNAINVVFLEFGNFEDQGKIDAFMRSPKYDTEPVIEILRNSTDLGWGYQEYFDIFKLIYDENIKRPPSKRIRLVLADPELEGILFDGLFYDCLKLSPLSDKQKWEMITWLRESIKNRDQCMSAVIEAHIFGAGLKGIFYAGTAHIQKDLGKKSYGRQYFSAGGILSRKYPGRVRCITFHRSPESWQNVSDFNYLEELFKSYGKPFAVDTHDSRISHLRLKSDVTQQGVALHEAFDGYIMVNQYNDYQRCTLIPGFYDDEFAKIVWDRLRKDRERFEQLPPEMRKTPTGEELIKMIKEGLR